MKARYYQAAAQESVISNVSQGKNDNLVVIPVGGGKSIVIGHLALWALKSCPGKKALVIAHRKELSTQNAQKIQTIDPSIHLGFEKAQEICPKEANVMMASIQTVGKEGIPRIRAWADPKDIAVVLIDEAHHIPGGKTYQVLLEEIRRENPQVIIIGFTATPKRGDGEKIEDYISHVAYEISMSELVENKFLARIIGFKIKTETSMENFLGDKRKDFDEQELSKLINNVKRNRLALDIYKTKHMGESALAFCVSKAHARDVADMFNAHGIKAAAITEDTPPKERDSLLEDFKAGKIPVLSSVCVLSEGFDAPIVKVLLMLRPTKSPVLLEQLVGRGLRLIAYRNPDDPEGEWLIDWESKFACHIYDFVDQKATQAGACNLATMLDLNPEFELDGQDVFALKSKMEAHTQGDPLLAAAMAQAHSPEEIEALLQSHNLLAELEAIRYAPNQKVSWMELSPTESWIQLPHGETARVSQNALGGFELHCPPINLEPRRKKREEYLQKNPEREAAPVPDGNSPDKNFLLLGDIHLDAENLPKALKEASDILLDALPCDRHLLQASASWKEKAKAEPATDGQLRQIDRLKIPMGPEELEALTKAQASELIDKAILQEKMMAHQGRITFGKYRGTPIQLIDIYDPSYIDWLLGKPELLASKGILESTEALLQNNPVPWLATFRPRLYHKDFAPMAEFYEKAWAKDPGDVKKTIKFALDHDPVPPWPLVVNRIQKPTSQKSP